MMSSNTELDFLSIVAHDLKTPISAVKGFIDLIEQAGPLTERQQHFSERAMMGLLRMERMVNDLLDYTRLQSEGMRLDILPCDMKPLVSDAITLQGEAAANRHITIEIDAPDDLQPVMGDIHLLSRVVNNLLSNAIKYNEEGGQVRIVLQDNGDLLRMEMQDTGTGIPQEDLPRIFDRFYRSQSTLNREGNGLGLAIVKTIVEKHGGQIWAESEMSKGTMFVVTLPYKPVVE
jgi:signal transduction histidine kinase